MSADGSFALEPPSSRAHGSRALTGRDARRLFALGVLTYAVVLIATVPASLAVRLAGAPDALVATSGTVWRGQALLAGGHRATWRLDPIRSARSAALAAQWRIEGPDTQLAGVVSLQPGGATLANVEGRADWSLIAAAAPGLPISCATNLRIDIPRALWSAKARSITGEIRANAGVCVSAEDPGGDEIVLPALIATAEPADGVSVVRLVPADNPTRVLLDALLSEGGALAATLHPEGARVLAGRNVSAPMTLETTL